MSLVNVFDIAGSAMSAQSVRLNTVASNLANVDSVSSSVEETYRARQPVFATMLTDSMDKHGASAGVQVKGITESLAPPRMEYAPNHPMANEDGYIFRPNVNPVEEMANMMSASRSYESSVEIMRASKRLMQRLLQLGGQ
jgi:flagellar basal-body rod protein FlgC